MPAGVTMKPSSSTTALNFTGTPTTAATYSFTVKVTGCGGNTSQMAYKVVIPGDIRHPCYYDHVPAQWNLRLQRIRQ